MTLIVPIVEGHGELEAVPLLLRRIAYEVIGTSVEVTPPYRVHASSFFNLDDEFHRVIVLISAKARQDKGIVLILLDCEDDCPASIGPKILNQASSISSDTTFVVCMAFREFETWFIFAAESLAGHAGLPDTLTPHSDPESLRDAKGWFGRQMPSGYTETTHQPSFTALFDLNIARQSHSFNRLVERISELL